MNNVKTMTNLFSGCEKIETLDLSRMNTNNVTNMESMFEKCSS